MMYEYDIMQIFYSMCNMYNIVPVLSKIGDKMYVQVQHIEDSQQFQQYLDKAIQNKQESIQIHIYNAYHTFISMYRTNNLTNNYLFPNHLYQVYQTINHYSKILQEVLAAYKPCYRLSTIIKFINQGFGEIFIFLKTYLQQKNQYQTQIIKKGQKSDGSGMCSRCSNMGAVKDIEKTKNQIAAGQFKDPYNMFDPGESQFCSINSEEDEQQKLKYMQAWENRKKIEQKFYSLQAQFNRRTYACSDSINEIERMQQDIKQIMLDMRNNQKNKQQEEEGKGKEKQEESNDLFSKNIEKLVSSIYAKVKNIKRVKNVVDCQVQVTEKLKEGSQLRKQYDKLSKKLENLTRELGIKNRCISENTQQIDNFEEEKRKIIAELQQSQTRNANLINYNQAYELKISTINFENKRKIEGLEKEILYLRQILQKRNNSSLSGKKGKSKTSSLFNKQNIIDKPGGSSLYFQLRELDNKDGMMIEDGTVQNIVNGSNVNQICKVNEKKTLSSRRSVRKSPSIKEIHEKQNRLNADGNEDGTKVTQLSIDVKRTNRRIEFIDNGEACSTRSLRKPRSQRNSQTKQKEQDQKVVQNTIKFELFHDIQKSEKEDKPKQEHQKCQIKELSIKQIQNKVIKKQQQIVESSAIKQKINKNNPKPQQHNQVVNKIQKGNKNNSKSKQHSQVENINQKSNKKLNIKQIGKTNDKPIEKDMEKINFNKFVLRETTPNLKAKQKSIYSPTLNMLNSGAQNLAPTQSGLQEFINFSNNKSTQKNDQQSLQRKGKVFQSLYEYYKSLNDKIVKCDQIDFAQFRDRIEQYLLSWNKPKKQALYEQNEEYQGPQHLLSLQNKHKKSILKVPTNIKSTLLDGTLKNHFLLNKSNPIFQDSGGLIGSKISENIRQGQNFEGLDRFNWKQRKTFNKINHLEGLTQTQKIYSCNQINKIIRTKMIPLYFSADEALRSEKDCSNTPFSNFSSSLTQDLICDIEKIFPTIASPLHQTHFRSATNVFSSGELKFLKIILIILTKLNKKNKNICEFVKRSLVHPHSYLMKSAENFQTQQDNKFTNDKLIQSNEKLKNALVKLLILHRHCHKRQKTSHTSHKDSNKASPDFLNFTLSNSDYHRIDRSSNSKLFFLKKAVYKGKKTLNRNQECVCEHLVKFEQQLQSEFQEQSSIGEQNELVRGTYYLN